MDHILVTGGAGYIGSFMVQKLLDLGYTVSVIDNLSRGYKDVVDKRAHFYHGDLLNNHFLNDVFSKNSFSAVIHFAGFISVGESVKYPDKYFKNNTMATFYLIEKMRENKVNNIIFSSTAAVYGNPQKIPITEDHSKMPESPYGESKLLVENGLLWYNHEFGINSVSLRYFNASGAALDGTRGERHLPETHIIPNVIKSVLDDKPFTLYGNDYETLDGTCIRDYIHILDLVNAHLLALDKLQKDNGAFYYNVGTGNGYTNKQVIEMIEKISERNIKLTIESRRSGDSAILVADNQKIKKELGFTPQYSDLKTIVKSAWMWHNR